MDDTIPASNYQTNWAERKIKLAKDSIKAFLEKYQNTPNVDIPVQEFTILQLKLQEFISIVEKENIWYFIANGEIRKKDNSGIVSSGSGQIIGYAILQWYPNKVYDNVMLKECPELPECKHLTVTQLNYSI